MSHRGAGLTRLLLQLQPQLPGGWGTPPALRAPASSPSLDRAAAWAAAAAGAAAGRAPPLQQQQQRRGYAAAEGGGALQKTDPPPEARQEQQQPRGAESEWTEVVDQQSGQTYFWNESTGETTELGEPRPRTRFRDSSFGGASDARFQEGWREPPGSDKTYTYSAIGALVGFTAGWATQFLH